MGNAEPITMQEPRLSRTIRRAGTAGKSTTGEHPADAVPTLLSLLPRKLPFLGIFLIVLPRPLRPLPPPMALKVDGQVAVDAFEPLAGKLDKAELQWPSSPESASPHHLPIVVDSSPSSSSSHSPSSRAPSVPTNGQSTLKPPEVANIDENGGGKGAKSKPASSVTAAKPASGPAGAKPKSTKPRSPSPAPSAPAQPARTIRLDIKLGGPEDYEVDISALSKETGQRPPTPTAPAKHDTSDESNSEGDDEGDDNKLKKKRRKVSVVLVLHSLDIPSLDSQFVYLPMWSEPQLSSAA